MWTLFLAAPLAANTAELSPLPGVRLRLTCAPSDPSTTRDQVAIIEDLIAFAQEHDGEAVYLDAIIEADDGAGGCLRDRTGTAKHKRPAASVDPPYLWMDRCKDSARWWRSESANRRHQTCWRKDMIQVTAMGPPLSVTTRIVIPREEDIPDNLLYRKGGYGAWLNYQGPFIVRHYGGTGYETATFTVPSPALVDIWRRARCNARPGACP